MKKIYCELDNDDYAQISIDDGLVEISLAQGNDMNVVVFSPDKIRKLRKQLKKALEAIEGVESGEDTTPVEEPKAPETSSLRFKVGDKVRIVGPASYTDQSAFMGQVREVSKVDSTDNIATYDITGLKGGFSFWFPASSVAPA